MRIDARIDANRCVHQAKYLIRDPMSLLSTVAPSVEALKPFALGLGIPSVLQAASRGRRTPRRRACHVNSVSA